MARHKKKELGGIACAGMGRGEEKRKRMVDLDGREKGLVLG